MEVQNGRPLVSVCIPNYNYGRYLRDCFDSLLAQTYPNIEISFSDNQSTDNSYEIAQVYRRKFMDKGIYFHLNQNKWDLGALQNARVAAAHVEGEILYSMASDDMIAPRFIERCMDTLLKYPNLSMVMTHRREIDEDSNEILSAPPFYNTSCIVDGESQAAVFMMAGIGIPGQCMCRKIPPKKTKFFIANHFVFAGDWLSNFSHATRGDFAYIAEPLYTYRRHRQSENFNSDKNMLSILEHFHMLSDFVEISKGCGMKKPAARYDEAVRKLGSMCLRYALKMINDGDDGIALKYLKLAPFFDVDIESEERYVELMKCLKSEGGERENLLKSLGDSGIGMRTVSYDPPEGFIPL